MDHLLGIVSFAVQHFENTADELILGHTGTSRNLPRANHGRLLAVGA